MHCYCISSCILILLYGHGIVCYTNVNHVESVTNQSQIILPMNIEWVLQGYSLGFTGFFIEYLGLSSAIVELLPYSTLQKSSYRKAFNESYFSMDYDVFKQELFPKEAKNIEYLISKTYQNKYGSSAIMNHRDNSYESSCGVDSVNNIGRNIKHGYKAYQPRFLYSPREQSIIKPSVCVDYRYIRDEKSSSSASVHDNSSDIGGYIHDGVSFIGGDLPRGYVGINDTKSANDCCIQCFHHILCLSWTFDELTGGV